ncbi:competence protein ComK [Aureibacillus halotolerans]|uniref:Competence protein ComK n=1 Tax=Aureibacillus halotolerans TaxID=1508390 RepID=A0A4R6UI83_9BACI|nr:competence protein ComK [Aureibacillus halotolerans]TDQ42874.1 competence protein ComK [Aureibacillus halotolerans]
MIEFEPWSIDEDYGVTPRTYAIATYDHITYQSIVFDEDGVFLQKRTPFQLIKEACLYGGSNFKGRLGYSKFTFPNKKKLPIAVDPLYSIFAYPTIGFELRDCFWIFASANPYYVKIDPRNTRLIFPNKSHLDVPISHTTCLKQQMMLSQLIVTHSKRFYDQ